MKIQEYRGFKIQPKHSYNLVWLDKLLLLINSAMEDMVKPHVLHIRFTLTEGKDLRPVMDRLKKHLMKKRSVDSRYNPGEPKCLVKKEVNKDQDGLHYHLAIVVDQWCIKNPCWVLSSYFHKMREDKLINDFSVLKPVIGKRLDAVTGETLDSLPVKQYPEKAVFWLSYLTKTETALLGEKSCWLTGV